MTLYESNETVPQLDSTPVGGLSDGAPIGELSDGLLYVCTCYDFVIEAVMMGALCLFGFAGNTVSMICLWHDRSKTATPFLLVSLEVADTLFLVTVFILRVLTSVHTFAYHMQVYVTMQ